MLFLIKMVNLDRAQLGQRIRRARIRAGLSQADLGKEVGMAYSGISDIELGKRGLDVGDLTRMAEIMGTTIPALVPEWFAETAEDAELRAAYWRLPPEVRPLMLDALRAAADSAQKAAADPDAVYRKLEGKE